MSIIRGEVQHPKRPLPEMLVLVQCQNGSIEHDLDAVYYNCGKKNCVYKQLPNGDLKFIKLMSAEELGEK